MVDCLAKAANDTEDTHKAFQNSYGTKAGDARCCHFDVPCLAELGLAEDDDVRTIAERISKWPGRPVVCKQVRKYVTNSGQRLGLEEADNDLHF